MIYPDWLKHMPKLKNQKLEIFARELARGRSPEQADEIANNFSGKLESEDQFRDRLSAMFTQRMEKFLSLFVEAKAKTFKTILGLVKAGCIKIDPTTATTILFTEECALAEAITALPIRWMTRDEFEALPTHELFRDDLFHQSGKGIDFAGAPLGPYRARLGGSWIVVEGCFFKPEIDGPSALN